MCVANRQQSGSWPLEMHPPTVVARDQGLLRSPGRRVGHRGEFEACPGPGEEAGQPPLSACHEEEVLRGRPHVHLDRSGSALGLLTRQLEPSSPLLAGIRDRSSTQPLQERSRLVWGQRLVHAVTLEPSFRASLRSQSQGSCDPRFHLICSW